MVITESLSAGVPVVISDVCGASTEVTKDNGDVLSLDSLIEEWVDAMDHRLSNTSGNIDYSRGWHAVAAEYENLYQQIKL